MIIGKKQHNRHRWGAGVEFGLRNLKTNTIRPRFEIWCYKILKYPPQGQTFDKSKDLKGFWFIFWLEKHATTVTSIVRKKGFRDRRIQKTDGGWRLRMW